MSYKGRTEFRTTRGRLIAFSVLSIIVLVVSIAASMQTSELWVRAVCWSIFLLSVAAIADLASSYIFLSDSEFRMRKNFRTQVVSKNNIESVSVEKGCPIVLCLRDGGRVELPDLAVRGIGNSLRAWLKAT